MKRVIEFPLDDGNSLLVEVDETETESGIVQAARSGEMIAKAHQTLDHTIEAIKPAANVIISKLSGLSEPPDEIEVKFGLKLTAEAGAILAASGVEANYSVKLKWSRKIIRSNET